MRTLVRDLPAHVGEKAEIQGWLHKIRKMGGLTFVTLRDRSGIVQILIKDKDEVEKLRGLQVGSVVTVKGEVAKDDRAPGGIEVHEPDFEVLVKVEADPPIEINKPIDHNTENFDTLFEYRPLNLRNPKEQLIFKVRALTLGYIREWLVENDFIEIQTPKLLAGATEGGAEVFKLDYFGKQAFLAQSPQLYKQIMVGVFERVFEVGAAYRAEPSITSRHLSEISMLDVELGFVKSLEDVLHVSQDIVKYAISKLWENDSLILEELGATKPKLADEFPRISMQEVHELYSEKHDEDTTDDKDLTPAEERFISEYALEKWGSEAVFVTGFPASEMKFYHKADDNNPDIADRADLIFRGVELATVPLREHRHEVVLEQLKKEGLDPEDPGYKYFLMAMEFGLPPHGGFGFGIDRFIQYIIGLNNIKEATLFPRDINRLSP